MDSLLSFFISEAAAQAAAPAAGAGGLSTLLLPVLLIVVFYFLLIRPQQKKQKEHRSMLEALAAGNEVVTGGGVLGKVTDIGEQFVTVEVANGVHVQGAEALDRRRAAERHHQERLSRAPAMNRYPLWKNLFVFGVVAFATLLALPNLFGDDEAVHVSRTDGVAVDDATLATDRRRR